LLQQYYKKLLEEFSAAGGHPTVVSFLKTRLLYVGGCAEAIRVCGCFARLLHFNE
jgi:MFS-type transporter involved in bile tolerance (Atg22 family)